MNIYSIKQNSSFVYEEKRSQFLAFSFYVASVGEANSILSEFKNKYADARHICYAYVVGENGEVSKNSDDGEPSGSAGKPILQTILAEKLTNILVIVVRYFGGVLLGKSSLLRAYVSATVGVINLSSKQVLCVAIYCENCTDYSSFAGFERIMKNYVLLDVDSSFGEKVLTRFWVKKEDYVNFEIECKNAGFKIVRIKSEVVRWGA